MKTQRNIRNILNGGSVVATWILGILGLATLSWLAFSAVTGATIVVFKTGSMSPTIPEGSAAIILPTAASELSIGDVVTVQRDGESLPVTHRIIAIQPVAELPESRELTLQGDANTVPDQSPYLVERPGKVIVSLAGAGTAIIALQSPMGLGILTVISATLITIAFWPHQNTAPARRPEHVKNYQSPG